MWFLKVVKFGEKIVVFVDYDVDGGSLVVFLLMWLCVMNCDVMFYVFDCIDEGYGFNEEVMFQFVS